VGAAAEAETAREAGRAGERRQGLEDRVVEGGMIARPHGLEPRCLESAHERELFLWRSERGGRRRSAEDDSGHGLSLPRSREVKSPRPPRSIGGRTAASVARGRGAGPATGPLRPAGQLEPERGGEFG